MEHSRGESAVVVGNMLVARGKVIDSAVTTLAVTLVLRYGPDLSDTTSDLCGFVPRFAFVISGCSALDSG